MKNRSVGILIISIAALIGFIIFSFNRALTDIVNTACSHGAGCPMWGVIDFHTSVSTGIMIFVVAVGLYLIFLGKEEKTITGKPTIPQVSPEKITKEHYETVMTTLSGDETLVLERIIEADGAVFQSELTEKTQFNKSKVTRILDRLEGKRLIERRRRGMSNVVVLKL